MCSKMDDTMEEEEMLASPSPMASPNTVCTRCPVLLLHFHVVPASLGLELYLCIDLVK